MALTLGVRAVVVAAVVTLLTGGAAITSTIITLFAGFLNSVTATGRRPTLTVGAADVAATGRTSVSSVALFAAVYYSISAEGGTGGTAGSAISFADLTGGTSLGVRPEGPVTLFRRIDSCISADN